MSDRRSSGLLLGLGLVVGVALFSAARPGLGDTLSILADFAAGSYARARDQLNLEGANWRPGEEIIWRVSLTDNVQEALALLDGARQDDRLPDPVRMRMAMETAGIEFARGRYREAYLALRPWLQTGQDEVPGAAFLRAALSLRALGQPQQARELLASVRPDDPAFPAARYYLGDIALDQGDPNLALRYLAGAQTAYGEPDGVTISGTRWRALLASADTAAAQSLSNDLARRHPEALANLEIRHFQSAAAQSAELKSTSDLSAAALGADGRFCLQYGAFSDRSLALAFVRRHEAAIADLRIERMRDAFGQYLYKVRSGSFNNPALARTEAERIGKILDLEVIVTELEASPANRE